MVTELVVDSSVALRAAGSSAGRRLLSAYDLHGPPLLWSEVTSAVTEATWRGEVTAATADDLLSEFDEMHVARSRPAALYATARTIAADLGWAKTYDAEFLALARIRGCRLVTADARLARGAERTGLVLPLSQLG